MKKTIVAIMLVTFLAAAGMTLRGEEEASGPEITGGVNFYMYNFLWNNTDFNNDTADSSNYTYGHGSIWLQADTKTFTVYAKIGAWGPFGMQPIFTVPLDPSARLLEGFVDFKDLIGPFTLRVGKWRFAYGDGLVAFDGGEDGTTGLQLSTANDKWGLDLFYRKGQDNAGWNEMTFDPTPGSQNDPTAADWNIWGAYATFNMDKFKVSPYFFLKAFGEDKPMWIGADAKFTPMKELVIQAEFSKLFGSNDGVDYTGFALNSKVDYTTAKGLNVGASYFIASGDDGSDSGKNNTYINTLDNPFTYGFYKGWVGFGPAHMTGTAAGFSCLAPWEYLVSNLTVLNFHVSYPVNTVTLRADFFKYDKQKMAGSGSKDMGYEIAGLAMTNIKGIDCGATFGMWMPGDHISKVLNKGSDSRYGGYFFLSKSFDFKIK